MQDIVQGLAEESKSLIEDTKGDSVSGATCTVVVVDCNRIGPGLPSAHFQDHIICIYSRT